MWLEISHSCMAPSSVESRTFSLLHHAVFKERRKEIRSSFMWVSISHDSLRVGFKTSSLLKYPMWKLFSVIHHKVISSWAKISSVLRRSFVYCLSQFPDGFFWMNMAGWRFHSRLPATSDRDWNLPILHPTSNIQHPTSNIWPKFINNVASISTYFIFSRWFSQDSWWSFNRLSSWVVSIALDFSGTMLRNSLEVAW
jgi:hypothetical protein